MPRNRGIFFYYSRQYIILRFFFSRREYVGVLTEHFPILEPQNPPIDKFSFCFDFLIDGNFLKMFDRDILLWSPFKRRPQPEIVLLSCSTTSDFLRQNSGIARDERKRKNLFRLPRSFISFHFLLTRLEQWSYGEKRKTLVSSHFYFLPFLHSFLKVPFLLFVLLCISFFRGSQEIIPSVFHVLRISAICMYIYRHAQFHAKKKRRKIWPRQFCSCEIVHIEINAQTEFLLLFLNLVECLLVSLLKEWTMVILDSC